MHTLHRHATINSKDPQKKVRLSSFQQVGFVLKDHRIIYNNIADAMGNILHLPDRMAAVQCTQLYCISIH